MAVSVTNAHTGSDIGGSTGARPVCLRVTMDASYPTGGESLGATIAPFNAFYGTVQDHPTTVADRSYSWDNTTQKLVAIVTSTGAQVANTVDLSADIVTLVGFLV